MASPEMGKAQEGPEMTDDKKIRAKIKELHAVAVQWAARAMRDADAGRHMDAQQNMRRANDVRYEALKLEQTLTNA